MNATIETLEGELARSTEVQRRRELKAQIDELREADEVRAAAERVEAEKQAASALADRDREMAAAAATFATRSDELNTALEAYLKATHAVIRLRRDLDQANDERMKSVQAYDRAAGIKGRDFVRIQPWAIKEAVEKIDKNERLQRTDLTGEMLARLRAERDISKIGGV